MQTTSSEEITQQGRENMKLVFTRLADVYPHDKWTRHVGEGAKLTASKKLWARVLSEYSEGEVEKAIRDIERGVVVFAYSPPDVGQFSQIVRSHHKPIAPVLSFNDAARIKNEISRLEVKLNNAYAEYSLTNDKKRQVDVYENIRAISAEITSKQLLLDKSRKGDL